MSSTNLSKAFFKIVYKIYFRKPKILAENKKKIFKRIARREYLSSVMWYLSMDLSRHALQINGKLFFKFWIRYRIIGDIWKIFERIARREYLSSAMWYLSMDSTRQALQTNGKLFSNFRIISGISYNFFR